MISLVGLKKAVNYNNIVEVTWLLKKKKRKLKWEKLFIKTS